MSERETEYTLTDEDGDSRIVFVHRSCGCMMSGCVDDEIQIYEWGDTVPYRLQVPRDMTPYLEGLFNGTFRLKKGS